MSDNQSLINTGGSDLSQTHNPQNIGVQNLSASQTNLQSSSSSVLNQSGLTISGVGSAKFDSVDLSSTHYTNKASTNSLAPLFIGLAVVTAIISTFFIWMFKKGFLRRTTKSN